MILRWILAAVLCAYAWQESPYSPWQSPFEHPSQLWDNDSPCESLSNFEIEMLGAEKFDLSGHLQGKNSEFNVKSYGSLNLLERTQLDFMPFANRGLWRFGMRIGVVADQERFIARRTGELWSGVIAQVEDRSLINLNAVLGYQGSYFSNHSEIGYAYGLGRGYLFRSDDFSENRFFFETANGREGVLPWRFAVLNSLSFTKLNGIRHVVDFRANFGRAVYGFADLPPFVNETWGGFAQRFRTLQSLDSVGGVGAIWWRRVALVQPSRYSWEPRVGFRLWAGESVIQRHWQRSRGSTHWTVGGPSYQMGLLTTPAELEDFTQTRNWNCDLNLGLRQRLNFGLFFIELDAATRTFLKPNPFDVLDGYEARFNWDWEGAFVYQMGKADFDRDAEWDQWGDTHVPLLWLKPRMGWRWSAGELGMGLSGVVWKGQF